MYTDRLRRQIITGLPIGSKKKYLPGLKFHRDNDKSLSFDNIKPFFLVRKKEEDMISRAYYLFRIKRRHFDKKKKVISQHPLL